jgi:DNA polymerase
MATVHPSSILRARTEEDRHREMDGFIADLNKAREFLKTGDSE